MNNEFINTTKMNETISVQDNGLTEFIPLVALRGIVVMPKSVVHFDVGRKKSVAAIEYALNKNNHTVFLVPQKDLTVDNPELTDLFTTGTVAQIQQVLKLPGEGLRVLVEGVSRAQLISVDKTASFFTATVGQASDSIPQNRTDLEFEALIRNTRILFDEYAGAFPKLSQDIVNAVQASSNAGELADFICANIVLPVEDKAMILSLYDPYQRLLRLNQILEREYEIIDLEHAIHEQVRRQIDKNQKEYYLREQLKVIQEELGEGDTTVTEVEEYRKKISSLKLEAEYTHHLEKEAARLLKMQLYSAEGSVVRTYLDTVLDLPWNTRTKDRINIVKARKILDTDHYGLEKVKERIIEFLSVKKLTGKIGGEILCLVGPPGVGKTSVAKSIARALNRKYTRISLGGVRDEADIRGHRKTYIGAMPGRIITAMQQAGSANPVILLDEVDKMGHDFRGDPASAMLEVLDSEQNSKYRDHFIEIPFDLSNVLFITTANTTETIPYPLLDRMELIELNTYSDLEKLQIAKKHLIPKQLEKNGLEKKNLKISDKILSVIISSYTREAGVRNLERQLSKLCRKAAVYLSEGTGNVLLVTKENLEEFLGIPRYMVDQIAQTDEIGVVTGLAWTAMGGDTLQIEANVTDGTGKLELTGSLGDVMKESAKAAISYIRSRCEDLHIDKEFYKNKDIHIHVPEGAIPKDGPSAGVTMVTALVSQLTKIPVKHDVAMTGEVTIRGRVLPIGGLKEKTMAAYNVGVKTVIIPLKNQPDLKEIDPVVKKELKFIFAENVDDVLKNALAK